MTDSRAFRAFQCAKRNTKALLALLDHQVQELAVTLGAQALVRVPYSVHGFPNGNYHRNAGWPKACRRINSSTAVRLVSEHDASKLLERCKACHW